MDLKSTVTKQYTSLMSLCLMLHKIFEGINSLAQPLIFKRNCESVI